MAGRYKLFGYVSSLPSGQGKNYFAVKVDLESIVIFFNFFIMLDSLLFNISAGLAQDFCIPSSIEFCCINNRVEPSDI